MEYSVKINFWHFVSALFVLYGVIILIVGIYYLMTGSTDPANRWNPSIWWGILMLIFSGLIYRVARKS